MRAFDQDGKLQQETADLSQVELNQVDAKELLYRLLLEARKTNAYLSEMSGKEVRTRDVIGGDDEI